MSTSEDHERRFHADKEASRVSELLLSHERRITIIEQEFHSAAAWAKWLAGAGLAVMSALLASNLVKP
jgi:hypothetical protein